MPELADLLERADRAVEDAVPLPKVGFDDLTRRRDRRQRNRRIRAGVVGVAIATGVAVAGLRALSGPVVVDEPPATPAFFVDIETGQATPLPDTITSIPGASGFQVSPDGSQLLFDTSGDPSAPSQVHIANVDGTDVRQLTEDPEGAVVGAWGDEVRAGGWSPDGSLVTYIGGWGRPTDLDEPAERGVKYADTGAAVYLDSPAGRAGDLFGTCVSPDGELKSYPIPSGGSKYLSVTPIEFRRPPGATVANDVSSCETFSIDGSSILFTKSGGDGSGLNPDLWSGSGSPFESGERSRLVLEDVSHAWPSPDGATLAASRSTEVSIPHGVTSATEIWLANADGSDPHLLVEGSFSGWSPDGTRILYLGDGVQIIDVASGSITTVGQGTLADWLDDDTLIVEGYEGPTGESATPSVPAAPIGG